MNILHSKPVFNPQRSYYKHALEFALSCGNKISVYLATLYVIHAHEHHQAREILKMVIVKI